MQLCKGSTIWSKLYTDRIKVADSAKVIQTRICLSSEDGHRYATNVVTLCTFAVAHAALDNSDTTR